MTSLATSSSQETFESMLSRLGLSERKPLPDPVPFSECDPLGTTSMGDVDSNDVMASIREFDVFCYLNI